METNDLKQRSHQSHAADTLRRLDAIGAINLDVLVTKSAEIQSIVGLSALDPEDGICYKFMVHIGPPRDFDLVSIASQVQQLGYVLTRKGQNL